MAKFFRMIRQEVEAQEHDPFNGNPHPRVTSVSGTKCGVVVINDYTIKVVHPWDIVIDKGNKPPQVMRPEKFFEEMGFAQCPKEVAIVYPVPV